MSAFSHEPVMPREVFEILNLRPGGIYLDCTLGGAGHASIACELVGEGGTVVGLDIDEDAIESAGNRLSSAECEVFVVKSSYVELDRVLSEIGIEAVDAILFDLGVSSYQLDEPERGFSYREDAPLDMRMDKSGRMTAEKLINSADERALTRIISDFGEERWAVRIARFITEARARKPITTTGELIGIIEAAVPKGARQKGIHPARRTFQALRIAVNTELDNVSAAIPKAIGALKPGGRLAVISFHSLEDRIVKELFRQHEQPCTCPPDFPVCVCGLEPEVRVLTRRPVLPKDDEIEANPRSRSAKLRAVEKIR